MVGYLIVLHVFVSLPFELWPLQCCTGFKLGFAVLGDHKKTLHLWEIYISSKVTCKCIMLKCVKNIILWTSFKTLASFVFSCGVLGANKAHIIANVQCVFKPLMDSLICFYCLQFCLRQISVIKVLKNKDVWEFSQFWKATDFLVIKRNVLCMNGRYYLCVELESLVFLCVSIWPTVTWLAV